MKKLLLFIIFINYLIIGYSQNTFYDFRIGAIPNCNPMNFGNGWKSSHGSPSYGDIYGQGNYSCLKLIAGDYESEGVFVNYTFKSNHKYKIHLNASQDTGQIAGLHVYLANQISQNSNSSCGEDREPYVADKMQVEQINYVTSRKGEFIETITNEFRPAKEYKQLWFTSYRALLGKGSFFVGQVLIEDLGEIPPVDNQPPSVPENLRLISKTYHSIKVAWNASTDNTGVKGYEIFKNGISIATTTSTEYTFNSLLPCTNYTLSVRAFDNYNNYSNTAHVVSQTNSSILANISLREPFPTVQARTYTINASNSIRLIPGFSFNADNQNGASFHAKIVNGGCDETLSTYTYLTENNNFNEIDHDMTEENLSEKSFSKSINEPSIFPLIGCNNEDYENINIYPNPTSDIIYVQYADFKGDEKIILYNSAGEIIQNFSLHKNQTEINLSCFPSGIYMLQIFTDNKIITKKIIKK